LGELPTGDAQNYLVYRFLDVELKLAAVKERAEGLQP
jgi:hypothetical protein